MGKTETFSAEELLDAIKEGKVVAPVGTKTFFAFLIGPNNEIRMEGTVAQEHVDEIAYMFMRAKREPKDAQNMHD